MRTILLELVYVHFAFPDDIFTLHEPGYPLWISREEYTIFGSHQLASESPEMEEREG